MFLAMMIYTTITDVFEALSQQPIIIPVPDYLAAVLFHSSVGGSYVVVASDYLTWTMLGAFAELGFAILFFVRYFRVRGETKPTGGIVNG